MRKDDKDKRDASAEADDLVRLTEELERRNAVLEARLQEQDRNRVALLHLLEELQREHGLVAQARREWITALDAVPDPIFIHDENMRVIRANRAYAARAGMDVRAVVGKPYWQMFPRRDGPLPACARALEERQRTEEELRLSTGEEFVSRAFPIHDADGRYLYSLHYMQDVTERRRAEAEQRVLSEAMRQAAEAVLVLDAEARIAYLNPAFYRLFGYTPAEILGRPIATLAVPGDDEAPAPTAVVAVLRERGEWKGEVRRRARDGTAIPVLLSAAAIRDAEGAITGYVGTYLDLRDIRRAEAALRESEQRFRSLIEHSSDIVAVLDREAGVRYLSPSALRLLGYAPEDLAGTDSLALVHPDDLPRTRQTLAQVLANPGTLHVIELRLRHKDGEYRHMELAGRNLLDDPAVGGIVTNVRDITDRMQAVRALKTLSVCNAALVHAQDEPALLRDICRAITETGGYVYAWIGYAEQDDAKRIKPVAQAGFENGFLEGLSPTWADNRDGRGPSGTAVREGAVVVTRDILNDPAVADASWRDAIATLGVGSIGAFPLMDGAETFGVLTIYSRERDAFDRDELMLLAEMAEDLNFGILTLRARVEHERLQEEHLKTARQLKETLADTIRAIALTVEKRDPYTAGHQQKVAALCVAIGRELGLPEDRLEGLRLGALIHDIGKVYIPAEILNRPGKLTDAEFEIIKSHPEVGYDIVKDVKFPWPVGDMILQHHEHLDGSGYPRGLKGEAIVLEARILAVADTVEAMSAHRPYRPALGVEKALAHIQEKRGTWYDLDAVDACVKLFLEKRFAFEEG